MIGDAQAHRSVEHLSLLFRLAAEAGALPDPELATARMRAFLTANGFPR